MKKQRRQNNIIICKNMLPAPSLKTKNLCKASERSHNLKKKLEKEIIEIFKIYKKKDEIASKPRPVLVKLYNQSSKNMVLDNSNRLKDNEILRKVIVSLDLSKEDREDSKKLLADKLKEVN